jgi:hypothetical protein
VTDPLSSEPMPGDGQVPYLTLLVQRLWERLPEVYRTFDALNSTWPFKRYLGAAMQQAGVIDDTIAAIAGDNPVGPATPEPWSLDGQELENWRAARRFRPSALGDPDQADAKWLTWLAQLVGARLDPAATETEKRNTIKFATSGWRAGTRQAIADAAKTALTGSKYAVVMPHKIPAVGGGVTDGDIWDVTIVTQTAETPDSAAVLAAVLRAGVKPAGVVLHVSDYGSTWDLIEAYYPTFDDIELADWDEIEQIGQEYTTVPGNILVNPSFEVDLTHWSAQGGSSTIGRIAGGLDGVGMCRVTTTGAGTGGIQHDGTVSSAVTPGDYLFVLSVRPDLARNAQVVANYFAGATPLGTQTVGPYAMIADEWNRVGGAFTAPATCDKIVFYVQVLGMGSGELFDVDAAYMRRVT